MNSKKAGRAFLISIICYIVLVYAVVCFVPLLAESLFLNNLTCELVLLLPIGITFLMSGEKHDVFLHFQKMKLTIVGKVILFTFLSMPLLTLLNLISQIWVDNEVISLIADFGLGEIPFWKLYLSIGIIAPFTEELICRGIYYQTYKKEGGIIKAILISALLFAFMHMNFNQAAYAFAMGVLSVLLLEATGSLWASVLYHGLINGSQTILMYIMLKADPDIYAQQATLITKDTIIYGIAVYFVLTAITLPLAWATLVWIRGNGENKKLLNLEKKTAKKDKILSVSLILALILCFAMMTGILPMIINKLIA